MKKIAHPFVVRLLSKLDTNPLAAASAHSGERHFDVMQNRSFDAPLRTAKVAASGLCFPLRDEPGHEDLPEALRLRKGARDEAVRNARNLLWLKVDWREKRDDAQFARSFSMHLPPELPQQDAENLIEDFCRHELVGRGMAADWAIHQGERGGSIQWRQAHIMTTLRPFKDGKLASKDRSWNERGMFFSLRSAWFCRLRDSLAALSGAPGASRATQLAAAQWDEFAKMVLAPPKTRDEAVSLPAETSVELPNPIADAPPARPISPRL